MAGPPEPQQLLTTTVIPGAATPASQIRQGCFREKGRSELLTFDGNQSLSLSRWFHTDEIPGNLAGLTTYWSTWQYVYNVSGPSAPNWPLASTDSFYIGDVDGDGLDEIVAWDGSANLALLKWDGTDIRLNWISGGGSIPGAAGQSSWSLGTSDRFYVGDITGDGRADIMAYDGGATLALIRWTGVGFELFWETSGAIYSDTGGQNWGLGASDWFHIADIDGDGQNEIIAFVGYPMSGTLGGIRWNGSDLRVLGMNVDGLVFSSQNPQDVAWLMSERQLNYVAAIEKTGQAVILAFQPVAVLNGLAGTVGVLRWTGASTGFEADFVATQGDGCVLTNPETGLVWSIGGDNIFTCADVDGDGVAEVIVQSDSAAKVGLLAWNGSALVPLWVYSTAGQNATPLPGWGLNVIANAPSTSFAYPSTDAQKQIYQKASTSITGSSSDVYNELSVNNGTEGSNFGSWAAAAEYGLGLVGQTSPPYPWAWMSGYDPSDLNAVLTPIVSALRGGGQAYGFYDDMTGTGSLLALISSQQTTDLGTVKSNMVVYPPEFGVGPLLGRPGSGRRALGRRRCAHRTGGPDHRRRGSLAVRLASGLHERRKPSGAAELERCRSLYQQMLRRRGRASGGGVPNPLRRPRQAGPDRSAAGKYLALVCGYRSDGRGRHQRRQPALFLSDAHAAEFRDLPMARFESELPVGLDTILPGARPASVPRHAVLLLLEFRRRRRQLQRLRPRPAGFVADDLSYPQQALTNDIFGTLGVSVEAFLGGADGWSLPTS